MGKALAMGLLLTLGLADQGMAQPITEPQTFNIFGKTNRAIGTYTTATATIPEGAADIEIRDTMTDQEASDEANSFNLAVFVSPDGVNWEAIFRAQFVGGRSIDKFTGIEGRNKFEPAWSDSRLQNGQMVGWLVRAELDQKSAMRVGFTVTVKPLPPQGQ